MISVQRFSWVNIFHVDLVKDGTRHVVSVCFNLRLYLLWRISRCHCHDFHLIFRNPQVPFSRPTVLRFGWLPILFRKFFALIDPVIVALVAVVVHTPLTFRFPLNKNALDLVRDRSRLEALGQNARLQMREAEEDWR